MSEDANLPIDRVVVETASGRAAAIVEKYRELRPGLSPTEGPGVWVGPSTIDCDPESVAPTLAIREDLLSPDVLDADGKPRPLAVQDVLIRHGAFDSKTLGPRYDPFPTCDLCHKLTTAVAVLPYEDGDEGDGVCVCGTCARGICIALDAASTAPPSPKFVPSDELRVIGQKYGFPRLVLVSWDDERTNVATWGLDPKDKEAAAKYGNMLLTAGRADAAVESHEDFRTTPRHELKAEVDRLKAFEDEVARLKDEREAMRAEIVRLKIASTPWR